MRTAVLHPTQVCRAGLVSCAGRCPARGAHPARHCSVRSLNNVENAFLGNDFGARDPTAGELATNFADSGLTHWDTAHIVKPPEKIKQVLGLTSRQCKDHAGSLELIVGKQRDLLKQQVPGWQLATTTDGQQCITHEWKAKDGAAAEQLAKAVQQIGNKQGHPISVKVNAEVVTAQLNTPALGGLTINDFIVAAKVNDLRVVDFMPAKRKRFWA